MNQAHNVWLDCDPGHDDMMAIIMAGKSQHIKLVGISTSQGNSTIEMTTSNALKILAQIGREDIPVFKGSKSPLCRNAETACDIHGTSGLEGAQLHQAKSKAIEDDPFWKIYQLIKNTPNGVKFVVTGASTNLAILLKAFPTIVQHIKEIIVMGGAIGKGNWNPAAEFNIYVDPQSAWVVVNSGIPYIMVPLQVTHQVLVTEDVFSHIQSIGTPFSTKLLKLLRYFQKQYLQHQNFEFPPLHDPCTIYYVLHPEHFKKRKAEIEIEKEGKSRGRTNIKFMKDELQGNGWVCQSMNVGAFWKEMLGSLSRIYDV